MRYIFPYENYSLEKTLLSGQVFNWNRFGNKYIGVIGKSLVIFSQDEDDVFCEVIQGDISEKQVRDYLDLDFNYDAMLNSLTLDKKLSISLKKFQGYRILKQNPYECLISFICSTNSNIRNTRNKVKNLSLMYGDKIDKNFYAFPTPQQLAKANEIEILNAKVGYRGKYIIETSKLLENSNILEEIEDLDDEIAIEKLTQLPGVGRKVADCVLLFSYHRLNRVPIDVWVKRILVKMYKLNEKLKYEDMEKHCEEYFGKYAGYASHFLFEHAREGSLL